MFDEDDDAKPTMIRPSDQSDMWELAQYIEEHPDDHEERWRLAKKMYLSWEYRHALEHLLVLKKEWSPRLNVLRYLAATYYRLGRYDEAIAELENALSRWPDEVGLREQLARVKELAGDRVGASQVWKTIAESNPEHPTASSAIRRLHAKPQNTPKEDLGLMDSDSGVGLKVGIVCPQCGAQNSPDETRCWQCNDPIGHPTPGPRRKDKGPAVTLAAGPSTETLVTIVAAIGLVIAGLCFYLSIRMYLRGATSAEFQGYQTLGQLYELGMTQTRLALGAALYLGWPAALWISLSFLNARLRIPPAFVTLTGLLLAGLAYLCTWLPSNALWLFLVVPPGAAALFIYGTFKLPTKQAATLWAMHLGIMVVVILSTILTAERMQLGVVYNPFSEIPKIMAHSRTDTADRSTTIAPSGSIVPIRQRVRWESTGSAWLDARAGLTYFTVSTSKPNGLKFEIKEDGEGTRVYRDVMSENWTTSYLIEPGKNYEILLQGVDGVAAQIEAVGIMRHAAIP